MQKQDKRNLLYSREVVQNVAPFLTINQLMSTTTLSKQWNYMVKQYISAGILPQEMRKGDELKQLKALYNRKLCILTEQSGLKQIKLPYIARSVSMGSLLTVVNLFENRNVLVNNEKLTAGIFEEITNFDRKFEKLVCSGDFLYGINDNLLTRISVAKEANQYKFSDERTIDLKNSIESIKFSPSHALAFTTQDKGHYSNVFVINHLTFKQTQLKTESLISPQNFAIGNNQCYYVNNYTVFVYDLNNLLVPAEPLKALKGKNIIKIMNGSGHFIAFQRDRKLVRDWGNKQVIQWLTEEGFEDYIKICKNEKITGQKLLTMDKTYMQDVLGITSAKVQSKMTLRIEAHNNEEAESYNYYVWGRNDKGQIGQQNKSTVTNPTKFKGLDSEFIVWHAEGHYTFLQKPNGQILFNKLNKNQGGNYTWESLTRRKIWSVSVLKRNLVFISSQGEQFVPQALSEEPTSKKKQKLRTAKNIIDQIQWDQKLDKTQFRVGYLDKFTGELECSFEELLASEVKQYRIMYFKRGNEILWDKAKRIDKL